jgi:hypothetical protein
LNGTPGLFVYISVHLEQGFASATRFPVGANGKANPMASWNALKEVRAAAVKRGLYLAVASCLILPSLAGSAQNPLLFITGLPCPGGQLEPTNTHPLVWQCRCADDSQKYHPWGNWRDTIQIDYGDVVAVTWFDQCKAHPADWNYLRMDVISTNQFGAWYTNSATVGMKAGYNFALSYIYWYTNNGSLYPTNFNVAQIAVMPGPNRLSVLSVPAGVQGTSINPPIWQGWTNPITNPVNWPTWGSLPDHYPFWPPWITNNDGILVIAPSAQLPVCNPGPLSGGQAAISLQGLPGSYTLQTKTALQNSWNNRTNITAGPDGVADVSLPLGSSTNVFMRASGTSPEVGLGYLARFQTIGSEFWPMVSCDNGSPQQLLWTWSDSTTSSDYPIASKEFGSEAVRFQSLRVFPADALTAINLGFDASDGGENTPLTNRPPQDVAAVYFPYPLTGLKYWASSYNPITNTLDFTGFTALQAVECFHCSNLRHVAVANLPSLKRLCFESCDLRELDLTGDSNIEDVRAAQNSFTEVKLGRGSGPKIWHWCIRDNPQITQNFQDIMTNFYALQEPWIWNANQSGPLSFVSTNLTDVEIQGNHYTSADVSQQPHLQFFWAENNDLTNVLLSGCISLLELRAQNNLLPGDVLDQLLTDAESAPNLQFVDLSANAELPSGIGYFHYSNLTNRGVIVYLDFPDANGAVVALDSATLTSESCLPANNAVDPGELVTASFTLKNVGGANTANLVATLMAGHGVAFPSAPQTYGALAAGGAGVTRSFSFTATGNCGGTILADFQLYDGATYLGTVSAPFNLGQSLSVLVENFDSAAIPDLPSGWTSSASGGQFAWITTDSAPDTAPNAAFAPDPPEAGISELVSPPITLPARFAQLSFRNSYDLEPDLGNTADDGGLLEIKIGTNSFTDIVAAGGTFASFGYNRTITNIYANPLSGRLAWSGNSGGWVTTIVNLPTAAQGQIIQLRWRCATDSGNGQSFEGWQIDSVAITAPQCCSGPFVATRPDDSRAAQ